ncbi:MAG: 2,4,5-trihydroxytoluene oxygenase [Myxococcota bacterium]
MIALATTYPARCLDPAAKAVELAYLSFERSDLEEAERFLTDFGLITVERTSDALWMRATGSAPYCCVITQGHKARFLGFAFRVSTRSELVSLSRVGGASSIEPIEGPGGGECVRLVDPNGFTVDAVHGQALAEPLPHRLPLCVNSPNTHSRINGTQRSPVAPPEVTKLGHIVLDVVRFQDTCGWYSQHFGMIPSDVQVLQDGSPAVVFMRMDRGDVPTDHHTLAIAQGFAAGFGHCAYEVVDADAVCMGQRYLEERGWRHAWGVGRHVLGSQVFDYWNDPSGAKHEHYSDGDQFTADHPMGVHEVSRRAMSQWGPVMPKSFVKPKFTASNLLALARVFGPNAAVKPSTVFNLMKAMG